jgi:hypothetical protein
VDSICGCSDTTHKLRAGNRGGQCSPVYCYRDHSRCSDGERARGSFDPLPSWDCPTCQGVDSPKKGQGTGAVSSGKHLNVSWARSRIFVSCRLLGSCTRCSSVMGVTGKDIRVQQGSLLACQSGDDWVILCLLAQVARASSSQLDQRSPAFS